MEFKWKYMQKLIIILGPTASGKTDLSIELAKKFKAEIVSSDSKQIYIGMDIGTGKVTEMQGIPHHLLSIIRPNERFSVSSFQKLATEKIKNIKTPFLVGGSPFYIYSIVEGWIFPEIQADNKLRQELENKSKQELFNILKELDQLRAETIDKHNKVRLIRAIEIAKQLGKVPKLKKSPLFDCLLIGVNRDDLKDRIEKRTNQMFEQGLEQEVRKLKDIPPIIGYQEWIEYFKGNISKEQVKEKIIKNTISFSKRQMTWFKKDKRIHWIKNQKQAEKLIKEFMEKGPKRP